MRASASLGGSREEIKGFQIKSFISFSMTMWSYSTNVSAVPFFDARPVRPIL